MTKKQVPSHQKVTKAALAAPKRLFRIKAAGYREAILILLEKCFSHAEIAQFLGKEGVDINQTAISRYLRKNPATETERRDIANMITAKPDMSRDQEPGQEVRQQPAHHKSSHQDAETPEEAASRKRREEMLAHARKNCPPPQPEEEDTTDYSFLDVKNRPFRIRPK